MQEMKTYALVSAAEIGDLATVQDCLTKRADVDFRNEVIGHNHKPWL